MSSLRVIALLLLISQTQAAFPNGFAYSSDVNSILRCREKNPFGFLEGEEALQDLPTPLLSFGNIERQPGPNGDLVDVWLPHDRDDQFPFPGDLFPQLGFPDEGILLDELKRKPVREGDPLFNEDITPIFRPLSPPPRACELIPSVGGSAGQEKIHVAVDQDPVPYLDPELDDLSLFEGSTSLVRELLLDPTLPNLVRSDVRGVRTITREDLMGLFLTGNVIRERLPDGREGPQTPDLYINGIEELCDIWIAKCPLTPIWAELPSRYFPRFLAQGTCSGKNCSIPRGLFCEEDFSYVAYTAVMRWDCCFNPDEDPYKPQRWECGWRRVGIPIVCDCTCACSEVGSENVIGRKRK